MATNCIGGGGETKGFWLGDGQLNALIAAPKSTEVSRVWGSYGTVRGTTNTTNGLPNTNTLYAFGSAAHPAAYYAKALTTGGYNTWYLPAKEELNTLYSNKSAVPFATDNSFVSALYWSSTELTANNALFKNLGTGGQADTFKDGGGNIRPIRRANIATTVGQGDANTGFWLGTAVDGVNKLIVAPKSTEVQRTWGSYGTDRGTTSTNNGLANTNTLFGFGSAAHPAAYYAKALTTGGYNTWYLPAKDELMTLYSNNSATPFATANAFLVNRYWSSTQIDATGAYYLNPVGGYGNRVSKSTNYYVRAVRIG